MFGINKNKILHTYLIVKVRKKIKKDNSTKKDYFIYCRSDKCGKLIKPDYRSFFDKRYCKECVQ